VHGKRTAAITEAVLVYVLLCCACLAVGVTTIELPGIFVTLASFTVAGLGQTAWLAWRSRPLRARLLAEERAAGPPGARSC
jgi:hypothetical protein